MRFEDISFNISCIITATLGHMIVYKLRKTEILGNIIWGIGEEVLFHHLSHKLQNIINVTDLVVKCSIGVGWVLLGIGLVLSEMETCGENSINNVCGVLYPGVSKHNIVIRDVPNSRQ